MVVEFEDGVLARGLISSPQPRTLQIDSNPPVSFAKVVAIYKEGANPENPSFFKAQDGDIRY